MNNRHITKNIYGGLISYIFIWTATASCFSDKTILFYIDFPDPERKNNNWDEGSLPKIQNDVAIIIFYNPIVEWKLDPQVAF